MSNMLAGDVDTGDKKTLFYSVGVRYTHRVTIPPICAGELNMVYTKMR